MAIKATLWKKTKAVIYIGGDPEKNQSPEITLELDNPQILYDSSKNTIYIIETK